MFWIDDDADEAEEESEGSEPLSADRQKRPAYGQIRAMLEGGCGRAPWTGGDTRRLIAELRRLGLKPRPSAKEDLQVLAQGYDNILRLEEISTRLQAQDEDA